MNLGTFVLVAVPLLIEQFAERYLQSDYEKTLQEFEGQLGVPRILEFDFIVVGGGTAGCVVAGRLSEHFSVLLLEAGGEPVPAVQVPGFGVSQSPAINDLYTLLPSPGQEWTGVYRPTFGRMLGGSSSHNGRVYNRGAPQDFDNWAARLGDPSWSYESVLEYFKRAENFTGTLFDEEDTGYYGYGGPMQISSQNLTLLPLWMEAAQELGVPFHDPNARQRPSFAPYHLTIHEGQRVSPYNRYILPHEATRANLTVFRYSDVQEILIDDQLRATGVAFNRHGIAQRAHARKEVIVSAGAFRSPLLLMKSGIGPADVLAEADIPARLLRPGVGRNLVDHVKLHRIGPIYLNDSSLLPRLRDGPEGEAELERYHQAGEGILADIQSGPQAFLVSSRAVAEGEGSWSDFRIAMEKRPYGIAPVEEGDEWFFLAVFLQRPRHQGSIRLNGTAWREGERDDQRLAAVDLGFLTDPSDVTVLAEAIERGLAVFENTAAFRRVGARYPAVPHEDCLDHWYRSEAYWRCYILREAVGDNHFAGSNMMGRRDDPLTVVDSQLKVIGVEGLRVVDASVMPVITNANIYAPVVMIGEKAAADILREHGALSHGLRTGA